MLDAFHVESGSGIPTPDSLRKRLFLKGQTDPGAAEASKAPTTPVSARVKTWRTV